MISHLLEEAAGCERSSLPRTEYALIAVSIVALTLLGFFVFPGHTWLQQDTQIYVPILEHLGDHSLFQRDLVAEDPHVSFTIYDETALGLRRLTGLSLRDVLTAEQLLFRALGILGVFLLARAFQLAVRPSLLVAGIFALGASIAGPAVLVFEYEPVPRGFAIPLVFLALGLAAHGRDVLAGAAISLAFLYHPPSVYPFWIAYFCLALYPARPALMKRRIWGLAPILCGVLVLFALSRLQAGGGEAQSLFGRLDPDVEKVQRWRATYVFVSIWMGVWKWHYFFLWGVGAAALWRVRRWASQDVRVFSLALPAVGMVSVPVSYLLLERWHWALIPQFQPTRALLFVTTLALILAAVAAAKAAEGGRYWETLLWLLPALAIPLHTRVLQLLLPDLSEPIIARRAALLVFLALCGTAALWACRRGWRWRGNAAWAAAVVLPFLLIPTFGKVVNYPTIDTPDLEALAAWARASTPKDAVFQFPDAGQALYPGMFRANSLRAVYADYKGGGQVNFLKVFARVWWPRWQRTVLRTFDPREVESFGDLGIDYVVLKPEHPLPGRVPVFHNASFLVYRLK